MADVQYVCDEDICQLVHDTCEFLVEDHGIGYYEMGDGKYNDISMQMTLTTQDICVQYPIDPESVIFTMITGTYYQDDEYGEYECDWMAELSHIEYNTETKMFDATYEVNEG
jgi:hypothetical protein